MQSLESQCRELSRFVLSAQTVEELSVVLKAVLTPAEIESIAQRLCILDGLSTGVAQREIAESLRVGIATVTRGSRVWQENRDCLGQYFPRGRSEAHGKDSSAPEKPNVERSAAPVSSHSSSLNKASPGSFVPSPVN
jgi:Trp operon repressor